MVECGLRALRDPSRPNLNICKTPQDRCSGIFTTQLNSNHNCLFLTEHCSLKFVGTFASHLVLKELVTITLGDH